MLSKKHILILIFSGLFFISHAQKTAANEDKIKLYNTALELYDKQLYNAAISNFNDFLPYATDAVNISDVEYYIASCKLKLMHNNALANMLDFIERYPQSRKINNANLEVGDYYYNISKFKNALTYYKKVQSIGISKEEKDKLNYRQGYCFFKSGKYKEARECFFPLTTSDNPYHDEATYYFGYVCYMDKDYKQALTAFKKVEDKGIVAVKLYIAEIYYLQNEHQKAIDYAQGKDFGALNTNRDLLLGKCYYRLNNFEKAQTYFDASNYKIETLNDAEAFEIGYTYYMNKSCAKSSLLFEKIANNGNAMAQSASYHLGDCYLKIGKKQNAFNAFYEAQRTEFDKSIQEEAMFTYAKLAHELEYTNKSIAAYQKFNELFPKSTHSNEAKKNLATLLYTSNDYKTAVSVMEEMQISDESTKELYQKILFLRGEELFNQKDIAGAKDYFKKSIAHKVNAGIYGQCNFWLGEIEYKEGKNDNARIYYQKFLDVVESKNTKYYPDALYSIGYTYFNQKKYPEAANYFNKYKSSVGYTLPENMFHDATLRLGDCYLATNNYVGALDAYTYIIANKKPGADYAMFQQGMIYGLQDKVMNKIAVMKKIARDFPNSPYIPDAIFETATEYDELSNYPEAERQFRYLIDDYPNSQYVKRCHMSLGRIYFVQNKYDNALTEYKFVAKNYPGTPEAQKAIRDAEAVYIKQGNIKEYIEWVKSVPNANISTSKEDSLYYDAAYKKYVKDDFINASKDFEDYLNNFNDGFFKLNAHYYAAICDLKLGKTEPSIPHLKFVADAPNSEFKEDAIYRLCNYYQLKEDCDNGIIYLELLEKYSSSNLSMKKALYGQIKCNNKLGNTEKAKTKAEQLLKFDQLSNEEKGESNNTIGRYYLHDSLYKVAKLYFTKSIKGNSQDIHGAEAKYYEGYMRFMQDSLEKCKKSIMEFNNQFSNYDFWLGKTFILLADYYLKKGDQFQAKATLNSVIENFKDEEIIAIARKKLDALEMKTPQNNLKEGGE